MSFVNITFWSRLQNCEKRLFASSCLFVRPLGTIRLPLHGFSWNLSSFRKIFRFGLKFRLKSDKNGGCLIWRPTYVHLSWYPAGLFLEWGIFQTKVVGKIKTHILCSIPLCRKSCCLRDNVEKCDRTRRAIDDNVIRRMRVAFWITKATDTPS